MGFMNASFVRVVPPVARVTGGTVIATWARRLFYRRTDGFRTAETALQTGDWMSWTIHSDFIAVVRS